MQTRRWAMPLTLMLSLVIPTLGMMIPIPITIRKNTVAQRLTWSRPCEQTLVVTGTAHHPGTFRIPYCASGADGGAVGIHFVNFALAVDGVLERS